MKKQKRKPGLPEMTFASGPRGSAMSESDRQAYESFRKLSLSLGGQGDFQTWLRVTKSIVPYIAVALALILCGCAGAKKRSTIFVLHRCQPIEQVSVIEGDRKTHEELTCKCDNPRQRLDAKSGRVVVECF